MDPAKSLDVTYRWPVVTAPLMKKAPVIDGTVERAEWTPAARLAPLMRYLSGLRTPDRATVYVGYTRDAVVMAFQFVRPPYALTPMSGTDPKGVWKDDCFEFFLRPDFGAAYEYSFVGNGSGVHAQGRRRTVTNKGWKCAWSYKARLTEWGWEGELAIPFRSLGRETPKVGQTWELAALRNRKTPGAQLASWSFIRSWLHRRDFGYLIFGGAVPAVRVLKAGPISSQEVGAVLEIANFSDRDVAMTVEIELYRPKQAAAEYFKTVDGAADLWGQATDATSEVPAAKVAKDALKQYAALVQSVRETVVPAGQSRRVRVVERAGRGRCVLHYRVTGKADGRIYAGGAMPFMKTDPLELALTPYLLSAGVVEAVADHQRLGNLQKDDLVRVLLVSPAGKVMAKAESKVDLGAGRTVLDVPVQALKPGAYEAVCRISDTKGEKAMAKAEYVLPGVPKWWDNAYGKPEATDTVPEPWTPMRRTPKGLTVWNRTVALGEALQPAQIRNGETDVLQSPVRLDLRVPGAAWGKTEVVHEKKTAISYRQLLRADGLSGELLLESEFDGLMKYTLVLKPDRPVTVERLVLDIPLKPELCTHYHHGSLGTPASFSAIKVRKGRGALPEAGLSLPFTSTLWLGNDEMGFAWYAESDQWWSPEKEKEAVQAIKTGRATVLRVNIITKPKELSGKVVYQWALLPTPTKPMNHELLHGLRYAQSGMSLDKDTMSGLAPESKDYLRAIAESGANAFGQWAWRSRTSVWNLDFGAPGYRPSALSEARKKAFREGVDFAHEHGIKWVIAYAIWHCFNDWPSVGTLWKEQAQHPVHPSLGWYLYCPEKPFADWYVDLLRQTIQEVGIDGVYLDSSPQPHLCANLHHGCGYIDGDGNVHGTYPVFATRELHKRIYTLFHGEVKQRGLVYAHNSAFPYMAVESFVDVHHCGEGSTLSKDAAIPKFYGHPFGVPVSFTRWNNPHYPETRMNSWRFVLQVDSTIKVHPSMVISRKVMPKYKGYTRESYVARGYDRMGEPAWPIWQAQKDFPWQGAQWIPSWKIAPYADSGDSDLWVCMHLNPGNAALVTVSDLREQPKGDVDCQLKLNWQEMGFDPGRIVVKDVILGKPVPHSAQGLALTVKEKLFRYLEVRPVP